MSYVEVPVRRKHLVMVARNAPAREGVVRTSPRAVAAEAGISPGTLQYVT
ncbi:hypothetical protein ACFZBU_46880 [Embleya sp. NPDC008237]